MNDIHPAIVAASQAQTNASDILRELRAMIDAPVVAGDDAVVQGVKEIVARYQETRKKIEDRIRARSVSVGAEDRIAAIKQSIGA